MNCRNVHALLSEYLDGALGAHAARELGTHLGECQKCAARLASLEASLKQLRDLTRLRPVERMAGQVLHRLEVESRGPGLALLFRPAWRARPLIFPCLAPAALILLSVLAAGLALDREPQDISERPAASWAMRLPPSGTEANPLFPSAGVTAPRVRMAVNVADSAALSEQPEGSLFFETVVARDGRVSDVTIIDGEPVAAEAMARELRRERFVPGRQRGRPVAVSVYRLISHMEVRGSAT
jgi:anti-sigma factor RsiW